MSTPTFDEFFHALHGGRFDPFPWQSQLARRVARDGWPDEIGIPTGLGKTTCLDIGVWAMAVADHAPRRLWYVVNRRLLVDAATERALLIAERLTGATDGPLAAVAEALVERGALGAQGAHGATPLHVARLRGGVPLDTAAPDPSQPTLLLATVPMFASRLLLRGYGVSRGMRPIGAAHAGTDATVLLDEAHLSDPLRRLMEPLRECDPGDARRVLPDGRHVPRLVALTATGHKPEDRFELTQEDHEHPIVRRRLAAMKPTTLLATKTRVLAAALAESALGLLDGETNGSTCVVFVNTAQLAPKVVAELSKQARQWEAPPEVLLLTGRLRAPDAEAVRTSLLDGPSAVKSGWEMTRTRPLVVVATQTLEVGADLDFEHLVTETAGVRAVVQRFGRCNRLGTRNAVASAVIVHPTDRREHPVYGDEIDTVWGRLTELAESSVDGTVDLGPANVDALGAPDDSPDAVPSLLPHHVWEWSKTSLDQQPPTPVEPFFSGLEEPNLTVSVFWRWSVPAAATPVFPRPMYDEVVDVPLWEVREFLADATPGAWCSLSPDDLAASMVDVEALRPGDTLLLGAELGGYSVETGWDPTSTRLVEDLSLHAGYLPVVRREDGRIRLPVELEDDRTEPATLRSLLAAVHERETGLGDEVEELPPTNELVNALVGHLEGAQQVEIVARLLDAWAPGPRAHVDGNVVVLAPPPRAMRSRGTDVRVDAFDDLSFDETSTALAEHLGSVGAAAAKIATALGLSTDLVESVRLAGALHDVGKADRRFQRLLDPEGEAAELLAKSSPGHGRGRRRPPSGWPRGGRHEELSGRAVRRWFAESSTAPSDVDRDLVLHLVVSHHGHGRPVVPPVAADRFAAPVKIPIQNTQVVVDGDLTQVDWEQPARFRLLTERYGTWGLTLLESIVRQADHAASAATRWGVE